MDGLLHNTHSCYLETVAFSVNEKKTSEKRNERGVAIKMQDERKPDKLSVRKYAENPNWAKNNKNKAQRSREHVHHTEEMSVWQFVVSLAAWVCPLSAMKGGSKKKKAGSSLIFR